VKKLNIIHDEAIPTTEKVTVAQIGISNIIAGAKSKAGMLTSSNFSALKIDTSDWSFDREKANERQVKDIET